MDVKLNELFEIYSGFNPEQKCHNQKCEKRVEAIPFSEKIRKSYKNEMEVFKENIKIAKLYKEEVYSKYILKENDFILSRNNKKIYSFLVKCDDKIYATNNYIIIRIKKIELINKNISMEALNNYIKNELIKELNEDIKIDTISNHKINIDILKNEEIEIEYPKSNVQNEDFIYQEKKFDFFYMPDGSPKLGIAFGAISMLLLLPLYIYIFIENSILLVSDITEIFFKINLYKPFIAMIKGFELLISGAIGWLLALYFYRWIKKEKNNNVYQVRCDDNIQKTNIAVYIIGGLILFFVMQIFSVYIKANPIPVILIDIAYVITLYLVATINKREKGKVMLFWIYAPLLWLCILCICNICKIREFITYDTYFLLFMFFSNLLIIICSMKIVNQYRVIKIQKEVINYA